MQSINVLTVTPPFMTALFGTAAACLGLLVWAAISWGGGPLGGVRHEVERVGLRGGR
jgi:uncharacterized membrane protein